jgi:hypothetical protein
MSIAKNIRSALIGVARDEATDLALVATRYCNDDNRQALHLVLSELDMATIAQQALLEGISLQEAGNTGPYADRAQRAAWAAGRLLDCLRVIRHAYALVDERSAWAAREANLYRQYEAARIEARAAWKAANISVPYREPRPRGGTPSWAKDAA